MRQVEQMTHQLAQAEESHGSTLTALQEELIDARRAARGKEEEVCELRGALEAARREAADARAEVSQLRHVISTHDAEIVGLKGVCKRWEERHREWEAALQNAEAARLSEIEVRSRHNLQGVLHS
jgi:chromosome segregation ATPase